MRSFDLSFFLLALIGTASLISVGVGIAEESIMIILASIVIFIVSLGAGFTRKKKLREQEGRA
ncbi:YlaF family protein [Bacillus shivajii]|uniref:DUF5325 family protein n=1 Tax=Bacillus shivajii TaxID=1983719 RepID=UPI001CF9FDA3|nr:DUF5325 family protein [Bacillus shivajii]UCZ51874.1 YlaF family protein [Bacillus shivajii]